MINKESDIKKTATSNVGYLVLRHDGIMTYELLDGKFKTDMETLSQELEVIKEWTKQSGPAPYLIDARNIKKLNHQQRQFLQDNVPVFTSKIAAIVGGGLSIYFYNLISYVYKPITPMKAFKTIEEAFNWLNEK